MSHLRPLETSPVRPRYLPPGTLRRLRLKWLALGVLLGAGLMVALAMYAAAIMPPELAYRSADATVRPTPGPAPAVVAPVEIPPCTGAGKDCTPLDNTPAPAKPHARPNNLPTHTVPEPGALALAALGLAALAAHRSHA